MIDPKKIESFDKMIKLVIKNTGTTPIYNCLLYLNDTKKGFTYCGANGNTAESNTPIAPNFRFRTGSITKPFTAAIILQLMEEGAFDLNDRFVDLVNNDTKAFLKRLLLLEQIDHTNSISINHLLLHQSGLKDYFSGDKRFFEHSSKFPTQSWNWKLVMEKYFEYKLNEKTSFRPGDGFHYSDTNYLLLAVLIEEICKVPFHEVLEKRILKPLELSETYLEFYQKEKGFLPIIFPFHGNIHLKKINTSFDWGGGGLVSNANDLNTFIRALVSGRLFKKDTTLKKMLTFNNNTHGNNLQKRRTEYGIGLQHKIISGLSFSGHTSAYGAMIFYESINEISIVISINQVAGIHKAEWLLNKVVGEYLS